MKIAHMLFLPFSAAQLIEVMLSTTLQPCSGGVAGGSFLGRFAQDDSVLHDSGGRSEQRNRSQGAPNNWRVFYINMH